MFETSLALAHTSLYLNPKNHIVNYLISQNLNSLQKKSHISYLEKIPEESYISRNSNLTAAELYIDLGNYKIAEKYLNKLEKSIKINRKFYTN